MKSNCSDAWTLTFTFYFLLHYAMPCWVPVLRCYAGLLHSDRQYRSRQLTTNSKTGAKVNNIKLENKIDNMFIFWKSMPTKYCWLRDHRLGSRHESKNMCREPCRFCSAFFVETFLAVKYLALSFLRNTSEIQGEMLVTTWYCFVHKSILLANIKHLISHRQIAVYSLWYMKITEVLSA